MLKIRLLQRSRLFFSIGIALVAIEQGGILNGWPSPILVQLQAPNSTIPTTNDEGSWITTITPLVSFFAAPLPSLTMHYWGRKISILLSIFPVLISWIMIALATTTTELIVARGIAGFTSSFLFIIIPVYLGEISPDNIRGAIGISMNVVQNIGTLLIYWIGTYPDLWVSSLASALPLLIIVIFYKWLPESPYYLVENNRKEEAKNILRKLNYSNEIDELNKIEFIVSSKSGGNSFKELLVKANNRRALLICLGTFTFAHLTGGLIFLVYAHLIFQRAGNMSANMMSIIKATLQIFTSIGAAYVVDTVGRKPLLIISCIGSAVFMFCEGVYFYLLDHSYNVDDIWWLPLTSMILFNISQVIGLQPISLAYLGELFHPKVKSVAVCVCKAWVALSIFIVLKLFKTMTDCWGNSVPFFIFGCVGVLGVIFVVFVVPETKGKSLEEIQYYMEHKNFRNVTN